MKTRTDLLNHLAEKYNLQMYLEIGVQVKELNFDKIKCSTKIGVDPDPSAEATCQCTSDEFFKLHDPVEMVDVTCNADTMRKFLEVDNRFDLIFIDGLHTAEQVKKDFKNSLQFLKPNGFIVLHDCNPEKEEHTIVPRPTKTGHWNGDVYKFAIGVDKGCAYTVNIDNGCLVYSNKKGMDSVVYRPVDTGWDFFNVNRRTLLNLISWDEFIAIDPHL